MTDYSMRTIADLDWTELWINARSKRGWQSKSAREWDEKSTSFAHRNRDSSYTSLLLSHLPLTPSTTVLDVGCGPGTLALPMARHCQHVSAIDFSTGMLDILRDQANEQGLDNISTTRCAWEDDWQGAGIKPHHLAIASRSLNVEDLAGAIAKLDSHATQCAIIVDRVSPTPFDPRAFTAVGRAFDSGPDYIYTVNMLYSMGIHANISILHLEAELYFDDLEQAFGSYSWMLKQLSRTEEAKLRDYLTSQARPCPEGGLVITRQPPRWALISWNKHEDNRAPGPYPHLP